MGKNKRLLQIAILLAVVIIGGLTVLGNMAKEHKTPKAGNVAPDFTLQGMDGRLHKLSDLKGKTVVLNFWATYCGPCREEMPAIQREADKWSGKGVSVLGVNIAENQVTVRNFLDSLQIQFPVVLDDQQDVRRAYGVNDYPTTFFIGPDGKIRVVQVGQMNEDFIDKTLSGLLASS